MIHLLISCRSVKLIVILVSIQPAHAVGHPADAQAVREEYVA